MCPLKRLFQQASSTGSLLLGACLLAPLLSFGQYQAGTAYFGTNDYVEYHAGNLPIIISAPHGGSIMPPSIPDRVCGSCVTVKDSWTEELAYETDSALRAVFGGYPHIIINKLSRKKLDANREIGEAALGNPEAETAWHEYHAFIQAAKDSCIARFGSAIFIDLHAHGHPKQRIELGYLLTRTELQQADATLDAANFQDSSAIRHLKNVLNPAISFADLLRGNTCMGELLHHRGYPAVPSATDPAPLLTDPFFSGGYNTARHGSRDSSEINAIQFETNYTGIRNSDANRHAFARGLACVLRTYLDRWYLDLDSWDPGHLVSNLADAGPGSLRSALLGAEDGTVITFDPALQGDTIRLHRELQICSDILLQGPGSGLLAISGADSTRILHIMPGQMVHVSGLSLIEGKVGPGEDGGAIWVDGQLKLSSCVLANNHAGDDGGAIRLADSTSVVELDSCRLINNSCGDDGGAIRCWNGSLKINATTFSQNVSPSYGGAISSNGSVRISNSSFSFNEAASAGGAIRNSEPGHMTCLNTTISENSCNNRGGGISTTGFVELDFCTLVHNRSTSLGGGIRVLGSGICALRNTLVAQNTGSAGGDVSNTAAVYLSNGHNCIGDTSGSAWQASGSDLLGNSLSPIDPLIMSLSPNGGPTETVALQAGSPCIDQADTTDVPLLDQRGQLRLSGPAPDIGAYERCLPSSGIDIQTACAPFVWIDGHTYSSSNDTARYTLTNAAGCDSVVRLDLTLHAVDTGVNQLGDSLIAQALGASFQWLDCSDGLAVLAGETAPVFIPEVSGSYAVEITQNGCTDSSACFLLTGVGIASHVFETSVLLHPNPTPGEFSIDLGQEYSFVRVHILNAIGQRMQENAFHHVRDLHLSLQGPAGLYIIEITNQKGQRASLQLIKE